MMRKKISSIVAVNLLLFSIFLAGCSTTAEPDTAKIDNVNQTSPTLNTNTFVNLPDNAVGANVNNTPALNDNGSSPPNVTEKSTPRAENPKPVDGGGGQDLLIFTKVRSALNSETEFINGVIVEIKDGNITLTGKVSGKEQKAKAEQLAKSVEGVKSVKNNLQVSQ